MGSELGLLAGVETPTGLTEVEEDFWQQIDELRLRLQPAYEAAGGAVAFIRRERDEDADF